MLWVNKYSVYSCFAACQEVFTKVSLVTDRVSRKGNANVISRVRLFQLYHFNELADDLTFCILWVMSLADQRLKVKVISQGQCRSRYSCHRHILVLTSNYDKANAKMCATRVLRRGRGKAVGLTLIRATGNPDREFLGIHHPEIPGWNFEYFPKLSFFRFYTSALLNK